MHINKHRRPTYFRHIVKLEQIDFWTIQDFAHDRGLVSRSFSPALAVWPAPVRGKGNPKSKDHPHPTKYPGTEKHMRGSQLVSSFHQY
ncbi:MAG: hypothetical protein AB1345_08970 [Chloroflexota bacterium]